MSICNKELQIELYYSAAYKLKGWWTYWLNGFNTEDVDLSINMKGWLDYSKRNNLDTNGPYVVGDWGASILDVIPWQAAVTGDLMTRFNRLS